MREIFWYTEHTLFICVVCMTILEQILSDKEQRRRNPSEKMAKADAQAMLLEGIQTQDLSLVQTAVKNGARVRGVVDGQDLFAACLENFNFGILNTLYSSAKSLPQKNLLYLLENGSAECLDYFSPLLIKDFDVFHYSCRYAIERTKNPHFVQWLSAYFDILLDNARANSAYKNIPTILNATLTVFAGFAGRMGSVNLMCKTAQCVIDHLANENATDIRMCFAMNLENVLSLQKTVCQLPSNLRNRMEAFLGVAAFSHTPEPWISAVIHHAPQHLESILKSPAGCSHVESQLSTPKIAEDFLHTTILSPYPSHSTQAYNVLRLKSVYSNWTSQEGRNIIQVLAQAFGFTRDPEYQHYNVNTVEMKKLVGVLLRINADGFHTPYPNGDQNKTVFDYLPAPIQAQVSKFFLTQSVQPQSTRRPTSVRKM